MVLISKSLYTAKNVQFATSVLTSCKNLINKPISGCMLKLIFKTCLITPLLQVVSTSCYKSANVKLNKDDFNRSLMKLISLLQLINKLKPASKIDNLGHACGLCLWAVYF